MYFIGHINPDTDTVCGAIAAANLYNGTPTIPGTINKETEFVLNYFNVEKPEVLTNIANKEIFVVDHNQTTQALDGYEEAIITGIIDHHSFKNAIYTTKNPINVIIKPYGSSCTIIAELYFEQNKEISKQMAGIMLAAILSDTLAFNSPTTTEKDKEIANKLIKIANIEDYMGFAKEMFKAKSNISSLNAKEIINLYYKIYELGNSKIGIGVTETVDPEMLLEKKEELIKQLEIQKQENNVDYIFFSIIDILNSHSETIIINNKHKEVAEKVFGGTVIDNILDTRNIISRKKQIVPPLTKHFS